MSDLAQISFQRDIIGADIGGQILIPIVDRTLRPQADVPGQCGDAVNVHAAQCFPEVDTAPGGTGGQIPAGIQVHFNVIGAGADIARSGDIQINGLDIEIPAAAIVVIGIIDIDALQIDVVDSVNRIEVEIIRHTADATHINRIAGAGGQAGGVAHTDFDKVGCGTNAVGTRFQHQVAVRDGNIRRNCAGGIDNTG